MIYLDTHIVVWLFAGQTEKISSQARDLLNSDTIYASPIVRLELQYLFEINRITATPNEIISDLSNMIGLQICDKNFNSIINRSIKLDWTRDPFDRIIVANAAIDDDYLVTKDQTILKNYSKAL